MASSIMVRKYFNPSWVGLAKGPQTSQFIISKTWSNKWLKEGRGSFFCLAIGQRIQSLLLWNWTTSGKALCKALSLLLDACPSLRCQRYGLETIGMLETEWIKELKSDCRIEKATEVALQFVEPCSK